MLPYSDVIKEVDVIPSGKEFTSTQDVTLENAAPSETYSKLIVDLDPEAVFYHEVCLQCSTTHLSVISGPL